MSPAKRMPLGLQARLIRTDLVAAGYEPELSDIRAFMDGSLSYPENRALVAKAFGYRAGTRRGAVPKLVANRNFAYVYDTRAEAQAAVNQLKVAQITWDARIEEL